MSGDINNQNQEIEGDEEDDFSLDPNDIVQIIDLDEAIERAGNGGDSDDGGDDNEMDTEEGAAAPTQDDSVLTFIGHKDTSVICTRLSPVDRQVAVTGGQDDQALVWNTQDGSILFQCTGHTDTVAAVGFSCDGTMVVTADMKGLIKVWRVDTGLELWSFEVSEIEWIQWHQAAPVLLAGTKDGQVWMWKVPSGDCKTFAGFGPSAVCGKIMPGGKHACVGYEDGAVKIWDMKSAEPLHTISGHDAHKDSVYCIDHNSNGSLLLSGSGDMTAKVINAATGKVVSTLSCQTSGEEDDSVEAVSFSSTQNYAVTGTLGGSLEIWDLPTKTVRQRCEHPYGIVKLQWSQASPHFYVAGLDGNVRQYDSRSGQVVRTWQGHRAGILDFDIARDESILVTASDDSTAKVFALQSTATR